jgi:4-amino-4-deoxy-L-arabinose transferase-like glycosyltransferase
MPPMSHPASPLAPAADRLAAWPAALVPCARRLWTHVLFPGTADADCRPRARSLALLAVLPALLLYPCLKFRLLEPDEGRYAEIPREMLVRGDWVVPHLQGEAYLDKPPLLYWLVALSYRTFGVRDWAARLVPALAVHGTILLTYLFGRRMLGERAAARGALLLALTPGLMGMGRILTLDGLLTFWVTLGIFAGWFATLRRGVPSSAAPRTGWWLLCALACGLGVLTKGPVAVLLVLPSLVLHHWLFTGAVGMRWRPLVVFAAVVLAVNLPWYVAVWVREPEFGVYFFVQHNLQRFLDPFDHLEPVWYYAPVLLGGLLPGTLLVWAFTRWLLSGDPAAAAGRSPALGFVLLAGGWCVLFFSLSGCKLPTYILPAFAPLALALGCYWARNPTAGCARAFRRTIIAWTVLLGLTHYVLLPYYAEYRSPMGAPAAAIRAACAAHPAAALRCYPRPCDSVSFYLRRDDVPSTRSKYVHLFVQDMLSREQTIVFLTHNHSLDALRYALPPQLRITREASFRQRLPGPAILTKIVGDTPWGLCHLAVVENAAPPFPPETH